MTFLHCRYVARLRVGKRIALGNAHNGFETRTPPNQKAGPQVPEYCTGAVGEVQSLPVRANATSPVCKSHVGQRSASDIHRPSAGWSARVLKMRKLTPASAQTRSPP